MGKKGNKGNKVPASPSTAPPPAPASWIDALSEEDRKIAVSCLSLECFKQRKQKMEEAAKKQAANQQEELRRQERNRQWEKEQQKTSRKQEKESKKTDMQFEKALQRGLKEGILQSVWGDDDNYWAQISERDWKQVEGEFYCRLCDKHLNSCTLEGHLDSKAHKNKAEWAFPGAAAAASASSSAAARPPPPRTPGPSPSGYGRQQQVEDWMEDLGDGSFKCIPCGKVITDEHLYKEEHKTRLQNWREYEKIRRSGYQAPKEQHLAFVSSDLSDPSSERWPKCLLCQKFSQDDWSHVGCVGDPNPQGSKEHLKNLRNYDWYADTVKRERLKWHPETAASAAAPPRSVANIAPAPWAKAAPAPWAKAAPASEAKASSPPPFNALPAGWEEANDGEGDVFYWNPTTGETQWDRPTENQATSSEVDTALPAGWKELPDEEGNIYYWNSSTGKTQWDRPTENTAAIQCDSLPPGWEVFESDGSPYYHNPATGETTWERPES